MPEKKQKVLRLRIPPSVPLALELVDDGGAKFTQTFRLGFNANVAAKIEEKTGFSITDFSIWAHVAESKVLRAMAWAAILPLHPEYDTVDIHGGPSSEGLEVIGSYIDESNSDDVFEALWAAYLLSVDPKKREAADKWMAEVKAVKAKAENAGVPAGPVETASTDTPISIDSAARSTATATDQTESAVSP